MVKIFEKKTSNYVKKNPQFNTIEVNNEEKQKIALLKNGNLMNKSLRVKNDSLILTNTCTFDSLIQCLAGSYAYHPQFREFADRQSNELIKLAILLAKKWVNVLNNE